MLSRTWVCFTLSLLLLVPNQVFATTEQSRTMVITALEAPPYVMTDANQQPTGILVSLIRQALKPLKIEPVFRVSSWARAYKDAKRGNADAIIPTIKSPDREHLFTYPSEPLTLLHMALLKRPGDNISFNGDLSELEALRIGKIQKARVTPQFDKAVSKGVLNIQERRTFGLLALGVARSRIDLMAGDELMGLWGAAENGVLNKVETITPYLAEVPVYLAISHRSEFAKDAELIAAALADAKSSVAYKQSLSAYERLIRKDLFKHLTYRENNP